MADAKERILAAALEVFARKGYQTATIREICRVAHTNLASVNYYFGDKQALYRTVVQGIMERALKRFPLEAAVADGMAAPQRLQCLIEAFLHRLLAPGGISSRQDEGRLLVREVASPSPILDILVEEYISPQAAVLIDILHQLLPSAVSTDQVMRCAFSIIGQCLFYGFAWPIFNRLYSMDIGDPNLIDALADHIAGFSLKGLAGFQGRDTQA